MNQKSRGPLGLAKKTFAVIAASITALLGQQEAKASPASNFSTEPEIEKFNIKLLKPGLILKQNLNGSDALLAMHASHRSHSSHSSHRSHSSHVSGSSSRHNSHASHASHASHYSSTPSATPSNSVPYSPSTTTSPSAPTHKQAPVSSGIISKPQSSTSNAQGLVRPITIFNTNPAPRVIPFSSADRVRRIMFMECEGDDVAELQRLLRQLKYTVPLSGYFGPQTHTAVVDFQKKNELKPDGRVDERVWNIMKNAVK